ncbi:MAG: ABC transporter ATP-binding protein [Desulfitobacteriaceae bacterium]
MTELLKIEDLEVSFFTFAGEVQAVRGVSFSLNKGESVAIVGESGCGKSVTAQSITRLIPVPPGKIKNGRILFQGKDLVQATEREMEGIRGKDIGTIFQDPMTSLNPAMTIGRQITEGLIKHLKMSSQQAKDRAIEMLSLVGISNPEKRYSQYPHEFSGGMRQRAMIAIALASNPKLLIADEPTTALDVTIQAQIIDLMLDLQTKLDTAIILITHDLGVVADLAERIIVIYGGKIIETGTVENIFYHPEHPYTWGLLKAVPRLDDDNKERLVPIYGQPPDLFKPPLGCPFYPRCDYAMKVCVEYMPAMENISQDHQAACWLMHPQTPKVLSSVRREAEWLQKRN